MTGENKLPLGACLFFPEPPQIASRARLHCHLFPVLLPCAQACAGVGVGARTAFFRADAFLARHRLPRRWLACSKLTPTVMARDGKRWLPQDKSEQ